LWLDYLVPEYERRPNAIVTVSSAGGFGGINCLAQLRLVKLGMGAFRPCRGHRRVRVLFRERNVAGGVGIGVQISGDHAEWKSAS
jgi:hypothetical protein